MKYPKYMVEKYRELIRTEGEFEEMLGRNFYDKAKALAKKAEEVATLLDELHQEAAIYAAETGADRDGSYDSDNLFDDLNSQLGEE